MPTDNERKALWFLVFVVVSGSGVRLWRSKTPPVPAAEANALARQLARVDSARTARKSPGPARTRQSATRRAVEPPAGDSQPVDLDRASAADIERLPGIGPALAQRIVAHRDSAGAFGDLAALCDVRGVGPALTERLRPLVTFSGPRRPVSDACATASKKSKKRPPARARQPS